MNARDLVNALHALGVEAYACDGKLRLYPGELVPVALRADIRAQVADVLALVTRERPDDAEALRRACARVGADFAGMLSQLLPSDLSELACASYAPPQLDAFLRAIDVRLCRLAGRAPTHWTKTVECRRCGPVMAWPDAPATLDACPWCWSRRDGLPIPRPASFAERSHRNTPEEESHEREDHEGFGEGRDASALAVHRGEAAV
jgi:hypothetical protein